MKHVLIIICLWMFPFILGSSQVISSQIITTTGSEFKNADISLTWTLGEPIIETFVDHSNILTQGFNQTKLLVTAVEPSIELTFSISAYPNPVSDFIYLKAEAEDIASFSFALYELKGTLLLKRYFSSNPEIIDFHNLSSGIYLMDVLNSNKVVKTFKIVKP